MKTGMRNLIKSTAALAAVGMTVFCHTYFAMATDVKSVELSLPVVQQVIAADEADVSATYELLPLDENTPLPEGAEGGKYSFSIKGNSSFDIPSITFLSEGDYKYNLRVVSVSDSNGAGTKTSPSELGIRIAVTSSGSEPHLTAVAYDDEGKKCELVFNHIVADPTASPTPTDTPKPSDTPVPTNTPKPSDTPTPTNTPKPTDAPDPTDTPEPTETPRGGGGDGGGSSNPPKTGDPSQTAAALAGIIFALILMYFALQRKCEKK